MDLSLGSNNDEESNTGSNISSMEKEYMFDKVVTPSDVGKLNRLVIPKQHAEKYFPLDSTSNEKGLLLDFEDRNGTSWRFRYSYWNSSQSYVMTKGWSRFVKENKLDAGDIVSFQRGVGEVGKDRFYIDWRRRLNVPDPTSFAHIQLQNQLNFSQLGGLYSLPQSYEPLHRLNFSIYPYNHHQQQQQLLQQQQLQHQAISYGNVAQYYNHHHENGSVQREEPMVIDSVLPVVEGNKTEAKRLRLFGVNMECSTTTTKDESSSSYTKDYDASDQFSPSSRQSRLSDKKGKSSLSFDLDL